MQFLAAASRWSARAGAAIKRPLSAAQISVEDFFMISSKELG
jgi:hypothetical protein